MVLPLVGSSAIRRDREGLLPVLLRINIVFENNIRSA